MVLVAKADGRIAVSGLREVQGTYSVRHLEYGERLGYIQRVVKHYEMVLGKEGHVI